MRFAQNEAKTLMSKGRVAIATNSRLDQLSICRTSPTDNLAPGLCCRRPVASAVVVGSAPSQVTSPLGPKVEGTLFSSSLKWTVSWVR